MKKTLLLLLIFSCLQINAQCWKSITAGNTYVLALKTDGTLWAWGDNSFGQFGNGTTANSYVPTKIGSDNDWKEVALGWGYTIAVKTDGTLWAWGNNSSGELGDGTTINKSIPTQIGTSTDWKTISVGTTHAIALKTNGTLWAWGYNYYGQLGNGSNTSKNVPTQIGTATWETISAGGNSTVAIKRDGTLWAWGNNNQKQLGDGSSNNKNVPTQISTTTDWKTISAGGNYTIAIKANGTLWAWGNNNSGQLGTGTIVAENIPRQIGTSTTWKTINTGSGFAFAIKTDNSLWAWGANSYGQYGNSTTTSSRIPIQVGSENNWQMASGSDRYSVTLKTDSTVWTCGSNDDGQLATGSRLNITIPAKVNCPSSYTITTSQANITCFGDKNGSATITAVSGGTAPYTYLWSNGATTATVTGLLAGNYTCTVKDASSLSITKSFDIIEPVPITFYVHNINVDCNNNKNGSLIINAQGGTKPYQYAISPLYTYQNSNYFTGLGSGNYTVRVKDSKGCLSSFTTITVDAVSLSSPTSTAQTFEYGAIVANLKADGINLKWYGSNETPNPFDSSMELQTGKYYVSQTQGTCESQRTEVNITINPFLPEGQIPTNGLIAYYPFNGNANDLSKNKSNGNVYGAVLTSDRFGNPNAAYSFNGTTAYIDATISNIPSSNSSRTISGWFKTDNVFSDSKKSETCIFNYGALEKLQRLSLSIYSKGYLEPITGSEFSSDDFYINNFNYASNDWYFFTLTYDGQNLSIYVNGKFVDKKSILLNTITNNLFRIGQRIPDNKDEAFKGTIDDIGIWNRVLTPEEITGLYSSQTDDSFYTMIPDSNFEERLIMLGIDKDGKNGKVLNTSISKVDHLYVGQYSIKDLTGISGFTSLRGLRVSGNELTSLDLSKNTLLDTLDCSKNKLRILNLKNGNNKKFYQLASNFSNNPDLTCIQVDDAVYSTSNWANIKDTSASFNTNCAVEYVILPDSNFEQKLIDLGIDTDGLNGKITVADASSITSLDLSNSNIKDLSGIENFTALKTLDFSNNQITTLDLSQNVLLETLNASSNQITTFDLSKNTNLKIVYVVNNPLTSLNLRNGNNKNFILPTQTGKKSASGLYTSFLGLTTLGCIQVDDANYSNTNWSKIKEANTTYSNTCKTLSLEDNVFDKVAIYPNPTKGEVSINNIKIEKANVYNSLGQLVKSFTFSNGESNNAISLSGLPKGIYYVYLINGDAASAKKIILE